MSGFDEDPSASTGRFQAFTERADDDSRAPWSTGVAKSRVLLFVVGVVVFAVLVGSIALSLTH
jgi:hypothetical protein